MMRVSVIGTGYVGLVTGVCLAEKGHRVICVDVDAEKVERVNRGISPIVEPGLDALLEQNAGRRLTATTDLSRAVLDTDVSLIAVGTPFDGREIDLGVVREVSRRIGEALRGKPDYHLVVVKSTVVPGTTSGVVLPILEAASGKQAGVAFGVGMNPEFLTEGEAVADFMFPDRIVLGGIDSRSIELQDALYVAFPDVVRLRTNTQTAEMIKYASNALLATLISFSNELANLSAALGHIDIVDVLGGVHASRYLTATLAGGQRVQPPIVSFLGAGCGFGGSCLPKDVKALVAHGEQAGVPMPLLDAVLRVNEQQPARTVALLQKHFPSLADVRIAVLGLAFRPETNDMRESPAIPIVRQLLDAGATLTAFDPVAGDEARRLFADGRPRICESLEQALANVQAVVLVTRWEQFRELPALVGRMRPQPVVVDGRRMLDKHTIQRYEGIGLSREERERA